jgi:hypothetical protein
MSRCGCSYTPGQCSVVMAGLSPYRRRPQSSGDLPAASSSDRRRAAQGQEPISRENSVKTSHAQRHVRLPAATTQAVRSPVRTARRWRSPAEKRVLCPTGAQPGAQRGPSANRAASRCRASQLPRPDRSNSRPRRPRHARCRQRCRRTAAHTACATRSRGLRHLAPPSAASVAPTSCWSWGPSSCPGRRRR